MAELLNRSRGLAEGVVVMICPVLLALALNIVDLNDKMYIHGLSIAMITMAGLTLITGITPLLVCCFSEGFPGSGVRHAPATTILATLSSCCLVVLACLIAQSIVSKPIFITVGVICGILVLLRTTCYYMYYTQNNDGRAYTIDMHNVLDESYEFLTGVTGILFLGFEGLALDGHVHTMGQKNGELVGYMTFIVCTFGVCLMFLEMTPPSCFAVDRHGSLEERRVGEEQIVCLTLILDCIMAVGIFVLLLVVMLKLTPFEVALWVLLPPVISFGQLPVLVALRGNTGVEQESRPASLELTKVTFTGFLAVSITTISTAGTASSRKLSGMFLLLSSMAIGFGLSWRLLSQANIRRGLASCVPSVHVVSAAKIASFCTHLCILIATFLFVVMAANASGK
ncbi:uncharacterized protein LOC123442379 isoform X1 [Hordeum vulgare subsp. vulgare]|nr:uncharacterized protein LOC123442379 isoform X1 [Hordeum vulgare subsp. vulgare]